MLRFVFHYLLGIAPPTNPPAKKITNIWQLCSILLPHMRCSRLVIFHLIFAIIEFSFSGLLEAFKHLLVRNEQHEFQSKESKSTLEMQCMSLSFSSIPDVSSGVPRGPYSGCCPSWGWRLMVDVCPCAWVDVCPCAHDVCRSWGSLAQVRLLICHQIAPRAA